MNAFGQVVIGPPGSGKTSYCTAVENIYIGLRRRVCMVNLDPANELISYNCRIDIFDLVSLEYVMKDKQLGPNGAMIYCLELLESNYNWLVDKINNFIGQSDEPAHFIFDLPGQVELFTHNNSLRNIFEKLSKQISLTVVNLIDCYHILDANRFVSVSMLSLTSMLQLELPHVNVVSKYDLVLNMLFDEDALQVKKDLIQSYRHVNSELSFLLDLLPLELQEVIYSSEIVAEEFKVHTPNRKYELFNNRVAELVSEFSLVAFCTLSVLDRRETTHLIGLIDKTNGYVQPYSEEQVKNSTMTVTE